MGTFLSDAPIVIDDDDEPPEISRPERCRWTQTPGPFVPPNPWKGTNTPSISRKTGYPTAEPEDSPPARQRSLRTADSDGLFVTPNPEESTNTPSVGRMTIDLTEVPEDGPPVRQRSLGTADSGGLFVRQPGSETVEPLTPVSRAPTVQIDLTLASDDEEDEGSEGEKKGDDNEKVVRSPHLLEEQPRGIKRSRSRTPTSGPADSYKRQMTDDNLGPRGRAGSQDTA